MHAQLERDPLAAQDRVEVQLRAVAQQRQPTADRIGTLGEQCRLAVVALRGVGEHDAFLAVDEQLVVLAVQITHGGLPLSPCRRRGGS